MACALPVFSARGLGAPLRGLSFGHRADEPAIPCAIHAADARAACAGTSAADLKFLHHVPRVRLRNFKSKSGTRIIELLVPFGFRSSYPRVPRCITNFENRALGLHGW